MTIRDSMKTELSVIFFAMFLLNALFMSLLNGNWRFTRLSDDHSLQIAAGVTLEITNVGDETIRVYLDLWRERKGKMKSGERRKGEGRRGAGCYPPFILLDKRREER